MDVPASRCVNSTLQFSLDVLECANCSLNATVGAILSETVATVSLTRCLHEAIVAAIGRATDRRDRSRGRSPRRSHRVNKHLVSLTVTVSAGFSHSGLK